MVTPRDVGLIISSILLALRLFTSPLKAQGTNPAEYTRVEELTRRSRSLVLNATHSEVDDQSVIKISFDEAKMAKPDSQGRQVEMRVEAFLIKGITSSLLVPIDNYISRDGSAVTYHDKPFDPSINASIIPDTVLNLGAVDPASVDQIELRITNLQTQETLNHFLSLKPFGFRVKVSDSLMFLRRLGVDTGDRQAGIEDVNFGPAPGITYGGTYLARGSNFWRFLRPGTGVNVAFSSWGNPTFDLATGQFAKGTSSKEIQVGMGIQFSLFNNVLQFTYGANLNVEQDRTYFGVGISFVNLASRLKGLMAE